MKNKKSRWKKIVVWGGAGVAGLLLLLLLLASPVATVIARSALATLSDGSGIGRVGIHLPAGKAGLRELRIAQPEGFGEEPMLTLGRAQVNVSMGALLTGRLRVAHVTVQDLTVHLYKNADGVMNVEALFPRQEPVPDAESKETADAPPAELPPVLIERVDVSNVRIVYTDASLGAEPLQIAVANLSLAGRSLRLGPVQAWEPQAHGTIELLAELVQEEGFPARIGLQAHLGPVGTEIPAVNAVLRIVGLEFAALGDLVPRGTAQLVGGRSMDIAADAAVAADLLSARIAVSTAGQADMVVEISGTPQKPRVKASGVLLGVLARGGGAVGRLAGNLGNLGGELAGTAVDAVGALGRGAMDSAGTVGRGAAEAAGAVGQGVAGAAGSLGRGLMGTVRGLSRGDLQEAGSGLREATVGSVSAAAEAGGSAGGALAGTVGTAARQTGGAIQGAADTVHEGSRSAAASASGEERAAAWRQGGLQRWETRWMTAQQQLRAMPFPPGAAARPVDLQPTVEPRRN